MDKEDNPDDEDEQNTNLDAKPVWREDFINYYVSVADQRSHDNPKMHLGMALSLVGETLSDCSFESESCRVHSFIVQGSGSGKDGAFDTAEIVAEEVKNHVPKGTTFDFHGVDNVTSGNLAGTRDKKGNRKAGLAEKHDILAFREVGPLFDQPQLRDRLRVALDENEVTREMRDGEVKLQSSCTLIGTTPPERIDAKKLSKLIDEGTLARLFYIFKNVDVSDSTELAGEILVGFSADADRERSVTKDSENRMRRRLVATLVRLVQEYDDGVEFKMDISNDILQQKIREQLEEELEFYSDTVQILARPLVTRYTVHALRLACIMAALDECSQVVDESHLDRALKFWKVSLRSMLNYFSNHADEVKNANTAALRKQRDEARNRLEFLSLILEKPNQTKKAYAEQLRLNPETVRAYAKTFDERGIIEVSRGKRARYVPADNSREGDLSGYM